MVYRTKNTMQKAFFLLTRSIWIDLPNKVKDPWLDVSTRKIPLWFHQDHIQGTNLTKYVKLLCNGLLWQGSNWKDLIYFLYMTAWPSLESICGSRVEKSSHNNQWSNIIRCLITASLSSHKQKLQRRGPHLAEKVLVLLCSLGELLV